MGFDAITVPAVAGNTDLTTWTSRPLTGNTDGDLGDGPNGSLYRWSSTLGEWVRAWVWDLAASFTLDNKIDGDVVPGAEDTIWNETKTGGTITTDGTRVSFDSTGANANTAEAMYDHGATAAHHFMFGHVSVTSITGSNNFLRWECRTGDYDVEVDIAGIMTSANVSLLDNLAGTPGEIGNRFASVTLATEKWLEVYIHRTTTPSGADGTIYVYIDNSDSPVLTGEVNDFDASAATQYRIGDNNSAASALTKVREVKVGRWA